MANQGLWHRTVHGIHGHVIAVVGSPPQGQFRHVTGTDHQTAYLVCHIHQDLGAFPRLAVFIGDILHIAVMPDIPKMEIYCLFDIDLPQRAAQRSRHQAGIIVSAAGGAETRHRHRNDIFVGQPQHIKSLHHHQKCQRRVQPTGNTHYNMVTIDMFQTFFQSQRLDR